ncbi:hypothetical protein F4677DRAFT_445793 [Hypoxylon crocopeplum]|nr:hypothetical protein F4677DRAFT_445793 [Hypoxylon crocopeplum]
MSFSTFIRILPLVSSATSFMCSAGQQFAVSSFAQPSMPAAARQAAWYPFFTQYKHIVLLSAPSHLATIASCIANIWMGSGAGNVSVLWWLAGIFFVFAHAYPLRLGLAHFALTEEQWRKKSPDEAQRWVQGFVDMNGRRLMIADAPGVLCLFVAVTRSVAV